jgi:outer membrane protein assembly factor BamB
MLVASIDSNSTFRDRFGFHKILLVGTSTGKVFGLDSSNGRIIWSQLLGTSTVDVGVDIQGVWTISPAKGGPSPRAVAIGVALADSVSLSPKSAAVVGARAEEASCTGRAYDGLRARRSGRLSQASTWRQAL